MKKLGMLVVALSFAAHSQINISEQNALAGDCSTPELINPKPIDAGINDAGYFLRVYETSDNTRIECIGNAESLYAIYLSGYGRCPSFSTQIIFCNIKLNVMNMTNLMAQDGSCGTKTYRDHNQEICLIKNPGGWMITITGKE